MGKLAKLVDGIKEKLALAGGKTKKAVSSSGDYGKLDKTGSMKVEIKSRLAQKLIAKNLALADSMGGKKNRRASGGGKKKTTKKRFFVF